MQKVWNEIKTILTAPVTSRLDPVHLSLIIVLILVLIGGWLVVLRYMSAGVKALAEEVST